MKRLITTVVVLAAITAPTIAYAKLKAGDKAPTLSIDHWAKGEATDPTKADDDKIFVVEFWATWCGPCKVGIPHLSELQDHFKKQGVTFIGVTAEKKSTVKKFLKNGWDAKMRYTIAIDDNGKTNDAWMKAAGQEGIPCAFLVKGGEIQWIGHPSDGLGMRIAKLTGDKEFEAIEKKRAEREEQMKKLGSKMTAAARSEKWDDALKIINEMIEMDPERFSFKFAKYHLLATKMDKKTEAAKLGSKMVKDAEDAQNLNQLAWEVLTNEEFEDVRDMELAMKAAKKAMKLSDDSDPLVIDTYARALADTGDLKSAIKWQTKAIELAEDKRMKKELKKALKKYEEKANSESA